MLQLAATKPPDVPAQPRSRNCRSTACSTPRCAWMLWRTSVLKTGPSYSRASMPFGRVCDPRRDIDRASEVDYARPGELLVSREVVDAFEATGVTFSEIGPVELKGVSGVVQLHAAHRDA